LSQPSEEQFMCDGQTDRRTEKIRIARPRLHCMQRGKNYSLTSINNPAERRAIYVLVR